MLRSSDKIVYFRKVSQRYYSHSDLVLALSIDVGGVGRVASLLQRRQRRYGGCRSDGERGCVHFYFESWSGEAPRSFLSKTANASWRGCSYGWVLLVVGLNSYGIAGEAIATIFAYLVAYREGFNS